MASASNSVLEISEQQCSAEMASPVTQVHGAGRPRSRYCGTSWTTYRVFPHHTVRVNLKGRVHRVSAPHRLQKVLVCIHVLRARV